jgi:plastocyanin
MQVRRWMGAAAVAALALGGLAGCGDDDDGGGASAATVVAKASKDGDSYNFDLPETLEGGTVTLTLDNTAGGDVPHELQLLKVDDGATFDDVKPLLESEDAPFPDAVQDEAGGVGTVAPGESASTTQELSEGTYVWFCTLTDSDDDDAPAHYDLGMSGVLTVEGDGADADAPDIAGSVEAREYGFTAKDLKAGTNSITFSNEGKEFHHIQAFPLADGASIDDVKDFLASEGAPEGPPPVDFEGGTGAPVIAPGQEITTQLTLAKGDYVFLCFITDRAGGPPHFTKGMVTPVTVS